jgi:hypothetical protein
VISTTGWVSTVDAAAIGSSEVSRGPLTPLSLRAGGGMSTGPGPLQRA